MGVDVERLWMRVRDYPNVVGYAPKLTYAIRSGRERNAWAFRVYVTHKVPLRELGAGEALPEELNGVPVDVVEFQPFFKNDIVLGKGFGWFNRYYVVTSYLLLGFLLHLMSFGLALVMAARGGVESLMPIPLITLTVGEAMIYYGLTKLVAEPL